MGIFDIIKEKISHEFIDIIEWLDYTDDTICHRFERYHNEKRSEKTFVFDVESGKQAQLAYKPLANIEKGVFFVRDLTSEVPTEMTPVDFANAAKELKKLDSPDEAIFYTSGRSSNEAAFLYGMFARALGTNNMPDCSNMCHESSGVALGETLGIGKGSIKLEDLYEAEVVIVAGQNPGTNHPRMLSALEKCKKNGGKVISINPLKESGLVNFKNPQHLGGWIGSGEDIADLHLAVKINQDIPLIKLMLIKLAALDAIKNDILPLSIASCPTDGPTTSP